MSAEFSVLGVTAPSVAVICGSVLLFASLSGPVLGAIGAIIIGAALSVWGYVNN